MNKHLRFLSLLCGIAALLVSTGAKAVNYDDRVYTAPNGRVIVNYGDKHYVVVNEADNLVTNGDFSKIDASTGVIEGWCMGNGTDGNGDPISYSEPATVLGTSISLGSSSILGTKMAYVGVRVGAAETPYSIAQAVNVEVGKQYVFLVKTLKFEEDDAKNHGVFSISYDTNGKLISTQLAEIELGTDDDGNSIWTQTAAVFEATTSTAGVRFTNLGDNIAFIADVRVYEVEEVVYSGNNIYKFETGTNLVLNGDFADVTEDGYISDWKTTTYSVDAKCWSGKWGQGIQYFYWSHKDTENNPTVHEQWVGTMATGINTPYSLMQSVQVEEGKYYIFKAWTKGLVPGEKWSGLYEMEDPTSEVQSNGQSRYIMHLDWDTDDADEVTYGNSTGEYTETWYENVEIFKAESPFVGIRMSWTGSSAGNFETEEDYYTTDFTGFQIYELSPIYEAELPLEDGVYVIQTIDKDNNDAVRYLGGSGGPGEVPLNGAQACAIAEPQQFTLSHRPDGSYRISSYQYSITGNPDYNLANHSLYLNDSGEGYLNGEAGHWYLVPAGEGTYTINNGSEEGDPLKGWLHSFNASKSLDPGYTTIGIDGDDNFTTDMEWTFISTEEIKEPMPEATRYNPVDVTAAYIKNPSWNQGSNAVEEYWAFNTYDNSMSIYDNSVLGNHSFAAGIWENRSHAIEVWRSNYGFNLSQVVEGLPEGEYKLSIQGFYQDYYLDANSPDGSAEETLPVLYATNNDYVDEKVTLQLLESNGQTACGGMGDSYNAFVNKGEYVNELIFCVDGDSNDVTIGVKSSNDEGQIDDDHGLWTILGCIKLEYLGNPLILHACTAEIDHWTTTGNNGHLVVNTWSNEADEKTNGVPDGSNLHTPFIENWVTGETLTEANIYHLPFNSENVVLAPGKYWATVDARAYSEAGNELKEGTVSFNVNRSRTDLVEYGTPATYGTEKLVYGTYTCEGEIEIGSEDLSIYFQVDKSNAECNWLSWKNLKVLTYDFPTITNVEGMMNAQVQATMFAAVNLYNAYKVQATYDDAVEAVEAAIESAAYYAGITAVVENLDEAGLEVWMSTAEGQAYEEGRLTDEDVTAALALAQKAQTTAGSDLTIALQYTTTDLSNWTAAQGDGPSALTETATETYLGEGFDEGDVLCCSIDGLQHGWYTISFYAQSNVANGLEGITGDGIAQAFANNSPAVDLTIGTESAPLVWDEGDVVTIEDVLVGEDGVLTFGVKNLSAGGNWVVAEGISLTLVLTADGLVERYLTDCDEADHMYATLTGRLETCSESEYSTILTACLRLASVIADYGTGTLDIYTASSAKLAEACAALEAAMELAEPIATGIEGITAEEGEDVIYTVTGVRVSKASQPGIYIINGKKVLVK